MRSQDENCRQGKKQGTKLVFSPKVVLRAVSPRILDLPYLCLECSSYSSLNLTALQLNRANLLHWHHFHETVPSFSPHVTHTLNLGMKLGFKLGFKASVIFLISKFINKFLYAWKDAKHEAWKEIAWSTANNILGVFGDNLKKVRFTPIQPNLKTRRNLRFLLVLVHRKEILATLNQHRPAHHHPLDACYYSVMDEPQLSVNIWFHLGNQFCRK